MTIDQAIVNAAETLGRASNQLFNTGYRNLAEQCTEAAKELRNAVAGSSGPKADYTARHGWGGTGEG